jgi:hypothetical protein
MVRITCFGKLVWNWLRALTRADLERQSADRCADTPRHGVAGTLFSSESFTDFEMARSPELLMIVTGVNFAAIPRLGPRNR